MMAQNYSEDGVLIDVGLDLFPFHVSQNTRTTPYRTKIRCCLPDNALLVPNSEFDLDKRDGVLVSDLLCIQVRYASMHKQICFSSYSHSKQ